MSKWKVERSKFWDSTGWDVYDHNGRCWKSFDTHAEALAYADCKARTREVVLPRVDFTIQAAVIDLFDEKGKLTHYAIDNADHIKLIATYLLAHVERMSE